MLTPTRLACFARGKKGRAVWQHPCRETVGSRLGRGGWTLMSLVALRVPGDAALPPALQKPVLSTAGHTGISVSPI